LLHKSNFIEVNLVFQDKRSLTPAYTT
jgi:hypothetical protein